MTVFGACSVPLPATLAPCLFGPGPGPGRPGSGSVRPEALAALVKKTHTTYKIRVRCESRHLFRTTKETHLPERLRDGEGPRLGTGKVPGGRRGHWQMRRAAV